MKGLDEYTESLTAIFKRLQPREAHTEANALLLEMAKDTDVFMEIVRRNILSPGFFSSRRNNPVIVLSVADNPYITIVANFWLPLPDRATNISHQSVHHHGKLLLTSVSSFGPGYESVIFKQGFAIDRASEQTQMVIDKHYKNPLHNIEFIDANTPHIVFYPKELSVTYALWTNNTRSSSDLIRKNPFIQKNKKLLLKILGFFKPLKSAVNNIEYFDFHPSENLLMAMKERVKYDVGSNENFIQNVFYILQQIKFTDFNAIESALLTYPEHEQTLGFMYLEKLKKAEYIEDCFEHIHLNVPKINFTIEALFKTTRS